MNNDNYCVSCVFDGYDAELFVSENLSRCLRCGKSTPEEVSGKEYWEKRNGGLFENERS